MITPQITYVNGDGPQTLSFLYPPTSKPLFSKQASRIDTFSTAGNRQSVVQRVNQTQPMTMTNILDDGTDATAWQLFLDSAVQGVPFEYFPDDTNLEDHTTCFLVETDATLVFVSSGIYSFSGTFQQEIT